MKHRSNCLSDLILDRIHSLFQNAVCYSPCDFDCSVRMLSFVSQPAKSLISNVTISCTFCFTDVPYTPGISRPTCRRWSWPAHSSHPHLWWHKVPHAPRSSTAHCSPGASLCKPPAPPLVRDQPSLACDWSQREWASETWTILCRAHCEASDQLGCGARAKDAGAGEQLRRAAGSVGSYIARTTQHCSHSYQANTLRWMDTTEKLREQWHRDIPSSDSGTLF